MPEGEPAGAEQRTILFVSNAFSYGGSEKHLLELLQRFNDTDVKATVLCLDSDPFTERMTNGVYPKVSIRSEKSLHSVNDWLRVFREIKPDAVVLVYGTLWVLPWFAAVAARLAGIKRLYAVQHLMPVAPPEEPLSRIRTPRDILTVVFGKRVRRMLGARIPPRLCVKTICVSNAVRDSLIRQYQFPSRKMLTIHNGVSPAQFSSQLSDRDALRERLGLSPSDFVLVCTARLSPEKGIDILISAMSSVVRKYPSAKCIILGEGKFRAKLQEQLESLDLSEHIFLEGFHEDVRPYLQAADAFVLASYVEGLPFSVLEAMAAGLPCVVTDAGGNTEAVTNDVNGVIVKPGSAEEVAAAIIHLMEHPQERARMAEAARSRVSAEFDIDTQMAALKNVILSEVR